MFHDNTIIQVGSNQSNQVGLKVIISDNISNLASFVKKHSCGYLENELGDELKPLSESDRKQSKDLAQNYLP